MPYILNKTNGTELTVVQDASLDLTTDLAFLGKNYAGYGEVQNENFLKLLENFSNLTPPVKPIDGQLWYDSLNKKLNVYNNDRETWKKIANLEVDSEANIPTSNKEPTKGDLWYNTDTDQLNVYNGVEFIVVGPPVGSDVRAQWRGDFEFDSPDSKSYNIKAIIGASNDPVAVVSAEPYTLDAYENSTSLPAYPVRTDNFTKVVRGITLVGADPVSGSTRKEVTGLAEDLFFWGTAAESLHALTASTSTYSSGISYRTTNSTNIFLVPFVSSTPEANSDFFVDPDTGQGLRYQPSSGILYATASAALYADIAERYHADSYYEPGTVLVIGGEAEVTIGHKHGDTAVAGIVSKNPAYRMNDDAGSDETHPHIALKGRVPCKVIGPVKKGDLLVTSSYPGYAERAADHDSPNAIVGRALESFNGVKGVIEVKI
jgi:hypothetical protein